MSNIKLKNMPQLTLADVLRRRKSTLAAFVKESSVQSYAGLVELCHNLGMAPPPEDEYMKLNPRPVTSQQDGIVVIEPVVTDDDQDNESELEHEHDYDFTWNDLSTASDEETPKKRKKKSKKD